MIEEILELLYEEDVAKKVLGTQTLWAAVQLSPSALSAISNHGTLIGALSRTLREDARKNPDLALALLRVMFCFSKFSDFHALLMNHRVGDACLRLLELEGKRHAARCADLDRLEGLAAIQSTGDADAEAAFRKADADAMLQLAGPPAVDVAVSASGPGRPVTSAGRRPPSRAGNEQAPPQAAVNKPGTDGARAPVHALKPLPSGRVDIAREGLRVTVLGRKQHGVLAASVSVLRNLADDVTVERKMCSRGIVAMLLPLLGRESLALVSLALGFLRKLSVFEENKDAMARLGIARLLVPLLPPAGGTQPPEGRLSTSGSAPRTPASADSSDSSESAVEVRVSALRLMFNLCFDRALCASFVAAGAVHRAAALLKQPPYRSSALRFLYHVSQDPPLRAVFSQCEALMLVHKLVVAFPQDKLPAELAALGVNLCLHPATAGALLDLSVASRGEGPVKALVTRAVRTCDPVVVKMVKGLAWHSYLLQGVAHDRAAAAEEAAFTRVVIQERKRERRLALARQGPQSPGGSPRSGADDGDIDEDSDEGPVDLGLMPDEPVVYEYRYDRLWAPHVRDLARLAVTAASPWLLAEALAALSSLTPRDLAPSSLTWGSYARDASFLGTVVRALECPALPNDSDDDVTLGALQLLATVALDPTSADALADAPVPALLAGILAERRGDADMLLQACCGIGRMLHHQPTREALVGGDNGALPLRLVELIGHTHAGVAAEAAACMHLVLEQLSASVGPSAPLVEHLRARRFTLTNREWAKEVAAEEAQLRAAAAVRPVGASAGLRPTTSSGRRPETAAGGGAAGAVGAQAFMFGDADLRTGGAPLAARGGPVAAPARPESRRSSQDTALAGRAPVPGLPREAGSQHPSALAVDAYRRLGFEALNGALPVAAATGNRGAAAHSARACTTTVSSASAATGGLNGDEDEDDEWYDDDGDGSFSDDGDRSDADDGSRGVQELMRSRMIPSTGVMRPPSSQAGSRPPSGSLTGRPPSGAQAVPVTAVGTAATAGARHGAVRQVSAAAISRTTAEPAIGRPPQQTAVPDVAIRAAEEARFGL